ncbi:S-layer homology domain-containing protein [Solibacillus sp. FSL H8-0538]|uniref:S-layer homology domain-containing protein n=1 Tax=Solibacillus sp. FSL H8-0538 TaxID=2921400 RepID=UPI0030F58884
MKSKIVLVLMALFVSNIVATTAHAQKFADIQGYATDTQAQVFNLAARNIIKGTSATTFSPNANITRGQVVKMMGRYVEASGLMQVPTNWEQGDRFNDVLRETPDRELRKYSALLHDMGVFEGQRGKLKPNELMTRENMALVLERLVSSLREYSLIDYAYDLPANVTDLTNAKVEARPFIEALNALQISTVPEFKPKDTVKRVHFASFLMKTIELIELDRQVLYFERTAEELGFSRIETVKTIEGSRYTVTFDEQALSLYTKFNGDEQIKEDILITGTDLFGRPHESSMRLVNTFLNNRELSIIPEYRPGEHGSLSVTLFLMHAYTEEVWTNTKTGQQFSYSTPYYDDNGVFINFNQRSTPIFEHTFTGYVMKRVDGKIVRTPKSETYRYYYDYEGVMITDNTATNYINDSRYSVTSDGDVTFNGEIMTDREFYYLPTVRPVALHWNNVFGGFTYPEDATLEEILAFHATDGKKSSIPTTFMHPTVIIMDQDKNIYAEMDLRDVTFGTFTEMK